MDIGYKLRNEDPKKNANILSKMFFLWMVGTVRKGIKKCFHLKDLYKPLDKNKSERLGDSLAKNWNEEILRAGMKKNPSFLKAITKTFYAEFMWYGVLWFIQFVIIRSFQPMVLEQVLSLFSKPSDDENIKEMYIYCGLMIFLVVLDVFSSHHSSFGLAAIGMRIRVASSSLIYRKITRLNQKALGQTAAGQVVNLLSNDVNRFDLVTLPFHSLWVIPFQVALLTYLMWQQVGVSSLFGIITMVAIGLPIQGYLGKLTGGLRFSISKKTDKRVKLMSEIVSGIQVIKMYAWEKPFEKIVKSVRAAEIQDITTTSYLKGIQLSCGIFLDRTSLFLTIVPYVLFGNYIKAELIFSLARSYNILQLSISIFYPLAVLYSAEALISVKRLQEFLMLEEIEESTINELETTGVTLNNVTASWNETTETLEGLNLRIPEGTLCAIVGPVGAGKSSLLQLLLGELPARSGYIQMGGEISYSSQEPWLFQSSVRKNILFGLPFEKLRYEDTVKVCALQKDFEQFPHGDRTIVGERGVSLSGGQRARINLARAVYRRADIYLLDDPLSAVDTHVGRHLFDSCIRNYLKGKTRILVTHQLQYLRKVDWIVVINKGVLEAQGTFMQLSESNLNFTELLAVPDDANEKREDKQSDAIDLVSNRKYSTTSSILNGVSNIKHRKASSLSVALSEISESFELFQESQRDQEESGSDPNSKPFKEYVFASKQICLLILLSLLLISAQGLCTVADFWIAYWTSQEELRYAIISFVPNSTEMNNLTRRSFDLDSLFDYIETGNDTVKLFRTDYAMYIYGLILAAIVVFTITRSLVFFKTCMLSSVNLHSKIFHTLLQAPMRFFDVNPSGRVLNRFSKDIGAIDEILPMVLLVAVQIFLVFIGLLINIGISNPYVIIVIFIVSILFYKMQGWYVATAKIIKHLEGTTKSPVFSHTNSTLNGITTIRASKAEQILIEEFDEHQDVHTSAWLLTIACTYSFGLWLDLICVIFITVLIISFVVLYIFVGVNGGMVGLAISQAMVLTGMLQVGMQNTAMVVNQLTSVERVMQYTKTDTEGPFETPDGKTPTKLWPENGSVVFKNLSLRYIKDDPPVLDNLNFTVSPGEKIGIVGRTGAGKSSLIAALFRLAPTEGSIFIDGIDTKCIGLTDLRKKISIIPQEPVLFSGTVRYNLDPFGEFKDEQIWKALELIELRDAVSSLDFMIAEGGGNFSLGQRQLICLARAALRNNKILVLDEATANVDLRTDSFIQTTIRERFKDCTVFTIAHRLNTIMDSDKVLVMSFGKMLEFDHPHKLLQIPDGHFLGMVQETGPVTCSQLKATAMLDYLQKYSVQESE